MYLEVLAAREDFAAAGKQTRERLLSRVDADVVDELVLGLERAQAAVCSATCDRRRASSRSWSVSG